MLSKCNHVKFARIVWLAVSEEAKTRLFLVCSMYNKTIIRFGFCDIQNNQALGMGYQPQPSASTLTILDTTKTSSNNCLVSADNAQVLSLSNNQGLNYIDRYTFRITPFSELALISLTAGIVRPRY